jgi:hypothetical protein
MFWKFDVLQFSGKDSAGLHSITPQKIAFFFLLCLEYYKIEKVQKPSGSKNTALPFETCRIKLNQPLYIISSEACSIFLTALI